MIIRTNEIWKDNLTGAKYQIVEVENDSDGSILNIKIRNINNKGFTYDLGYWELKQNYHKVDDNASARRRG